MANKLRITLPLLAAFLFVGLATPLFAAKPVRVESPTIVSVTHDYDAGVLNIVGNNLAQIGTEPTVILNDVLILDVAESFSPNLVVASVPEGFDFPGPGDYELLLDSNLKGANPARMWLTLGAIGPKGADGATGSQGPAGNDGADGLPGPPGANGVDGADGEVTQAQLDAQISRILALEKTLTPCVVPAGPGIVWPDCDKTGVDLRGVDLTGADLTGTILLDADLSGSNLTEAVISNVDLRNANLTGAILAGAEIISSNLSLAILDNVTWSNTSCLYTYFSFPTGDYNGTDLSNADLSVMDITNCYFWDANLSGADLTGLDLRLSNFGRANFTDANLEGANMTGVYLVDAIWSNTTCPDGSNSDDAGNGGVCPP